MSGDSSVFNCLNLFKYVGDIHRNILFKIFITREAFLNLKERKKTTKDIFLFNLFKFYFNFRTILALLWITLLYQR